MDSRPPMVVFAALLLAIVILAACAPASSTPQASALATPAPVTVEASTQSPSAGAAAETTSAAHPATDAVGTAAPPQDLYKGVPVGFTPEGFPYRGNPEAPITVYEYSDYQCPFCERHVVQTEPALLGSFVETGQVKFVFRDMPLESLHPNAIPAAIAANCVAEQGIVLFWRMHDQLFRTQSAWESMRDPGAHFAALAEEVGADLDAYQACVADGSAQRAQIDASLAEAQDLGFSGTPSFRFVREETGESFTLVGAQPYNVFADWLQTIADGGTPVDPAEAQRQQQGKPQIPFWATAEGLAPDPDRPGYTVAGDQYRGNPEAPVVVVEFSDFQCPFCRQHVLNTQPVLDEKFVDPGDVLWVFKHFPIQNIHPYAISAGIAAECAGQQGAFWEVHDRLFQEADQWTHADNRAYFVGMAGDLGLDADAFAACLDDEATLQAVQSDLDDGAPFVRGTPTFVVLYGGQGRLIPGALPADQFVDALDQMLAEATGTSSGQ